MRRLGTIMAIILLTVVLGFTIPTAIGAITGFASTQAGEVGSSGTAVSSTTTGSGRCSIPRPGSPGPDCGRTFTSTRPSSAFTPSPPTPNAPPPSASTSYDSQQ